MRLRRPSAEFLTSLAIGISLGAMVAFGIAIAIDSGFGHRVEPEPVVVLNREHTPARDWTTLGIDDEGNLRTKHHHEPARYRVTISGDDGVETYSVNGSEFPLYIIGQHCTRRWTIGCLTGWRYGRQLDPTKPPDPATTPVEH